MSATGQVVKLTASDAAAGDRFGSSVAIDNDTVVVGAYWEDGAGTDRGAAYIFERNQGGTADQWGQAARLTASDAQDGDFFGCSVSISDDTVVVGAYGENGVGFSVDDRGAAYVFERNQGGTADNWGQVTRLRASDAANHDYFGYAVAISGDQILVGAYGENGAGTDRGAAYVFSPQPYQTYLPLTRND
ncbi:MAG: FG-GAP repeat protein [Anaerolineae bacterium]